MEKWTWQSLQKYRGRAKKTCHICGKYEINQSTERQVQVRDDNVLVLCTYILNFPNIYGIFGYIKMEFVIPELCL